MGYYEKMKLILHIYLHLWPSQKNNLVPLAKVLKLSSWETFKSSQKMNVSQGFWIFKYWILSMEQSKKSPSMFSARFKIKILFSFSCDGHARNLRIIFLLVLQCFKWIICSFVLIAWIRKTLYILSSVAPLWIICTTFRMMLKGDQSFNMFVLIISFCFRYVAMF